MKCFYHPKTDAVGLCKNCYRGLCEKSLVEVDDSLACKDRCEEQVKEVNKSIRMRKYFITTLAGRLFKVFLVVGILQLILGALTKDLTTILLGCFTMSFGIIFLKVLKQNK